MNWDELQQHWKDQERPEDPNMEDVMHGVEVRARKLRRTVFWRDVREVLAALFVVPVFIYMAAKAPPHVAAGAYACAACALGVAAFLVVDRLRQPQPARDASPADHLREALAGVEHQVWLLRNVFWWYLLPLDIGMAALVAGMFVDMPLPLPARLVVTGIAALIIGGVTVGVYWLNQRARRKQLEPQRDELLRLLREWAV